jgi:membrane protein DedA with SNARE-associated domain
MITSTVNGLWTALLHLTGWPVYAAVGALAFAEAAAFFGLVVPGETAMLLGGVLAGRHQVALGTLLTVAIGAAIAGDSVGYFVGARFGPRLRRTWPGRRIRAEHWARAERMVRHRGAWAVVLGRWVGVLRALVPTAAGMVRMPYRTFVAANAAGGAAWAGGIVLAGYAAGPSASDLHTLLGRMSMTVVGLAAVGGVWVLARRHLRRTVRAPTR